MAEFLQGRRHVPEREGLAWHGERNRAGRADNWKLVAVGGQPGPSHVGLVSVDLTVQLEQLAFLVQFGSP